MNDIIYSSNVQVLETTGINQLRNDAEPFEKQRRYPFFSLMSFSSLADCEMSRYLSSIRRSFLSFVQISFTFSQALILS